MHHRVADGFTTRQPSSSGARRLALVAVPRTHRYGIGSSSIRVNLERSVLAVGLRASHQLRHAALRGVAVLGGIGSRTARQVPTLSHQTDLKHYVQTTLCS